MCDRAILKCFIALVGAMCGSTTIYAQETDREWTIEEIVVTATKRTSSLQDTPLAVSVVSMSQLDRGGVRNLEDLATVMPGLHIGTPSTAGTNLISLRGISSSNIQLVGDPAVAYHIDGVYLGRQTAGNATFFDLERVEVVKGPQGTLYGRNATAGSINVITAKPKNYFEASIDGVVGDYNRFGTRGMINVPVIEDKLAVRAVFLKETRDGYFDNGPLISDDTSDTDETAFRLQALYTPKENLDIRLSVDYQDHGGAGAGDQRLVGIDASPDDIIDPFTLPLNTQNTRDDEYLTVSTEVNWDLGAMSLTYIGAYYDSSVSTFLDFDRNPTLNSLISIDAMGEQTSHEMRLASNEGGPLEWLVGVFYFNEDLERYLDLFIDIPNTSGLFIKSNQPDFNVQSAAIFGQATYNLSDTVRLTGGLRYTKDEKTEKDRTQSRISPFGPPVFTLDNTDGKWDSTDWKVGIDWYPVSDTMVYASVGSGFKAGGFNANFNLADPVYQPEEIVAYQFGHKSRLFDNSLQINSELFYYDYTDLQLTQLVDVLFVTENAASAEIYGIDTDIVFAPTDSMLINLGLSYLSAKFQDLTSFDPIVGQSVTLDSATLPKSPEWSVAMGIEQNFMLPNDFVITPRINFQYESEVKFREFEDPGAMQSSFTRTDFSVTLESPSGHWFTEAFIHNIENDEVYSHVSINGDNSRLLALRPPRTIGVRVKRLFGGE